MHFRLLFFCAAVLAACGLFYGCSQAIAQSGSALPVTVSFGTDISDDATWEVLSAFNTERKEDIREVKFEKGTYHFYPEKGREMFCYISNHKDVRIRTAFPLTGMHDLVIDGQGSTFIFHGRMIPFVIEESKNITLKNLAIDWADSFHSEGLIVANNPEEGTFDLKISEEYPYEIRNGQLIFVKPYYEHPLGQTILYDPKTNGIAYRTEEYTPLTSVARTTYKNFDKIKYKYPVDPRDAVNTIVGKERRLRAEQLEPGLVRIYNHTKKLPEAGMILTAKGHQWENRIAPAVRIVHSENFVGENVDIHHAGGMGLIAENTTDLTLRNFNITPSQGRMVSTTADATHFVGCRGKISITDCTFNNQLDDAANIHGTYQIVQDVLGANKLGVRMGHHQQQGFQIGYPGERIGVVDLEESFFSFAELTIKSVEKINSRYHVITFNEAIPEGVNAGQLIENTDAYPELLVQNCNISRNRARGLLLSTPRKIVVDNNFFGTEMEAILVPVESGHWYEAGSVTDLTITNNTFQDCNISGYDRGVIRFIPDDENENIAFSGIDISKNQFNQFDNLLLEINNVDDLRFTGNTITDSRTYSRLFPENPAVKVRASSNIIFEDNSYGGSATEMLDEGAKESGLKFR
ncbi:right-handed parallel beta-helix repeat-containing protein [Neolewinella aurantiaca]|uniref:Right-handed parallel beta-helix repeat-containing protein n=1 Tax=Neolewinella aurantiaca TaxID=2602767 RepID=A0A5C7F9E6_9BACT|nr:right-handed parallel beta-helix repeat-containing protein [Neolewinella aurantiaca]TXF86673.1 right-handed parallel beta-helix repeat-containing protein [Neolewinella aurantiaca]